MLFPARQFAVLTLGSLWLPLWGSSNIARAQPEAPLELSVRAMTLQEALVYARAHQPAVRAALARLAAAKADARIPSSQWLPFFTGTAQILGATANNTTASYFSVSGVDLPRIGGTRVTNHGSMDPSASTVAAVGVQQEVFDFGRISAQGAVQDFGVDVEKYSADEQRLLSDLNVAEAYFAVFAARSVLQASEDAYQRARVHRDLAKAKVAGGLRPPIDLTRTEADLTRFDVGRIRARGGLDAAQINFAAAVGLPQQKLDAKGEPPPPFDVPSLAEALVQWAKSDPILQAALARLRAQQAATRAIQAELRPNLALSATFSGREGGAPPASGDVGEHEGSLPAVPNWDVGLILRWPLYDGVVLARRDASLQREQVRKAELDLVKQQQVAAIGQAHVNVTVTRAALAALEHALEAAKANYDQADARFKAGLANTVELADAEAVRTEAEIQLALGRLEVARARAELGRLIAEGP